MQKWPENLQNKFFDEMQTLSDAQCNSTISCFCIYAISEYRPKVVKSIFKSNSLTTHKAKVIIDELGDDFWISVDGVTAEDQFSQTLMTYLYWSIQNHYRVDGAMEIMDDLIDAVSGISSNIEDTFVKVFDVVKMVKDQSI